ncbi:MAG: methylated-DNA--[protein]-cysteine S-methyltransferase [Nonomuraea sp.]|nr:methylated-DNA--[protein]-cysteine S-methyltransferase [Nonomuraea sp.]
MIDAQTMDTPAGPLTLLARDGVLVAAGFTGDPHVLFDRLSPGLRTEGLELADDLGELTRATRAYFAGDLTALDTVPLDQPGTATRKALHKALREVAAGTTVSYGELAERAGLPRTAARAAGSACSQNLIAPFVPCHRVLPSTGGAGSYLYGTPVKEWLLAHESGRA